MLDEFGQEQVFSMHTEDGAFVEGMIDKDGITRFLLVSAGSELAVVGLTRESAAKLIAGITLLMDKAKE